MSMGKAKSLPYKGLQGTSTLLCSGMLLTYLQRLRYARKAHQGQTTLAYYKYLKITDVKSYKTLIPEAELLVMCNPSMKELWAT